ncbi:helix-turn-helix domain-containing protein [Enterococcus sp. MSG3310]|uniref:helix-turn-helix domain-containing protein n=1 Tax=Enterococcus sp. MSG3310 TaxID=2774835 RepID=UPI003D2FF97F
MRMFLDAHYDRVLHVAAVINNNKRMTINEVSKKVGFSVPSVRKIIEELEKNELSTKNNLLVIRRKNIVGVHAKNYPVQELSEQYIEKSVLFFMIKKLLEEGSILTDIFCLEYGISKSVFSRNKIRLKKILQSIRLDLSPDNQILGNEWTIRSFFIKFIYNSRNLWSLDIYNNVYPILPSVCREWGIYKDNERHFLNIVFYVMVKRIGLNCSLEDTNLKTNQIHFENTIDKIKLVSYLASKKVKFIYIELYFFIFHLRIKQLIHNKNDIKEFDRIQSFVNSCHNEIDKAMFVTLKKELEDIRIGDSLLSEISLLNTTIKNFYVPDNYFYYVYEESNFYSFNETEKNFFNNIKQIVAEKIKIKKIAIFYKSFIDIFGFEELVNCFFILLYGLYVKEISINKLPLKIYIDHSKPMNNSILESKLKSIFHENITIVRDDKYIADLLITDYSVGGLNKNELSIASYADNKDFQLIMTTILQLLEKR